MKHKENFHVNCRHQATRVMMNINQDQGIDKPLCVKRTGDKIVQNVKHQRTNEKCVPENEEKMKKKKSMPSVSQKELNDSTNIIRFFIRAEKP
jgi:hypothetical protein